MNPQEIINLEKFTTDLVNFLEYINTDEMEKMDLEDNNAFIKHLEIKFEDFSLNHFNTFKMFTNERDRDKREANLTKLLSLVEMLKDIKDGNQDMNQVFEKFREQQAEEFLYPQYGGKEKFEEAIIKRSKRRQQRKNKKR